MISNTLLPSVTSPSLPLPARQCMIWRLILYTVYAIPGHIITLPHIQMIGDIVRVRYVATLQENDKVVMSTKNVLGRAWVEFVLGIDQVIKGFDRALPRMSVGERSKLIITPEYGCKYSINYMHMHIHK